MSDFMRGAADAMLEGRASNAESSARLAQAEADSLRRKVWWLENELREMDALAWKLVGEREGFKSLLVGFSECSEKMLASQKKELYRSSILRARHYLNHQVKKNLRLHVEDAWTRADFFWGLEFPLIEFPVHGSEPTPPTPPEKMKTITQKLLGLIPYRTYFVQHQCFHLRKNAEISITKLEKFYEEKMQEYNVAHDKWTSAKMRYENQQKKINEYSLI